MSIILFYLIELIDLRIFYAAYPLFQKPPQCMHSGDVDRVLNELEPQHAYCQWQLRAGCEPERR